jgi:hypothetical protein
MTYLDFGPDGGDMDWGTFFATAWHILISLLPYLIAILGIGFIFYLIWLLEKKSGPRGP